MSSFKLGTLMEEVNRPFGCGLDSMYRRGIVLNQQTGWCSSFLWAYMVSLMSSSTLKVFVSFLSYLNFLYFDTHTRRIFSSIPFVYLYSFLKVFLKFSLNWNTTSSSLIVQFWHLTFACFCSFLYLLNTKIGPLVCFPLVCFRLRTLDMLVKSLSCLICLDTIFKRFFLS